MNLAIDLTKRESEVAEQLALGSIKKEVADSLNISVTTVGSIARSVYHKIDVSSVNELSAWFFCRRFNATIIISDGKRKIVALMFLLLFALSEVSSLSVNARTVRSRATYSARAARTRKNELDYYIDYLIEL